MIYCNTVCVTALYLNVQLFILFYLFIKLLVIFFFDATATISAEIKIVIAIYYNYN